MMASQQHRGEGGGSGGSGGGLAHLNLPFGDTTFTKVFVGGLAWETTSESLRRYFLRFGPILESAVISDRSSGRSKGYGFVTFRDPESAAMACADPYPFIDGRRANCNLASLGRPQPFFSLAPIRPGVTYIGGVVVPRGTYLGSPNYQQPVPYHYPHSFVYPSAGHPAYGSEYLYPPNAYIPYAGQQYVQVYGVPSTGFPSAYSYGQFNQPGLGGQMIGPGYTIQSPHAVPLSAPNVSGATSLPLTAYSQTYPSGAPLPPQTQTFVPGHAQQFIQGDTSERTYG